MASPSCDLGEVGAEILVRREDGHVAKRVETMHRGMVRTSAVVEAFCCCPRPPKTGDEAMARVK